MSPSSFASITPPKESYSPRQGVSEVIHMADSVKNLINLYSYIFFKEKSHIQAQKLIAQLFERTDQLHGFPYSGQIETLLSSNKLESRYIIVANYKLIYEYHKSSNRLIIIDVFHTSQSLVKLSQSKK